MKLFLASEFGNTGDLLKQVYDISSNASVAYIANAADGDGDKSWMKNNRDNFERLGFSITDVDLRELQGDELKNELESHTAIYVEGGNTFYLLDLAYKFGCIEIIRDLILNRNKLYIGTSAGSIVAGPNISSTQYIDDLTVSPDLTDFSGFRLVNFVVVPHIGNSDFYKENKEKYFKLFKNLENYSYPHICIRDNQAIWVNDDHIKILEI